jgi:hypothetical protein
MHPVSSHTRRHATIGSLPTTPPHPSTPVMRRLYQDLGLMRGDGKAFGDGRGESITPDPAYNERHLASEFRGRQGLRVMKGSDPGSRDQGRGMRRTGDPVPILQAGRSGISDTGRPSRRKSRAGLLLGEASQYYFNM